MIVYGLLFATTKLINESQILLMGNFQFNVRYPMCQRNPITCEYEVFRVQLFAVWKTALKCNVKNLCSSNISIDWVGIVLLFEGHPPDCRHHTCSSFGCWNCKRNENAEKMANGYGFLTLGSCGRSSSALPRLHFCSSLLFLLSRSTFILSISPLEVILFLLLLLQCRHVCSLADIHNSLHTTLRRRLLSQSNRMTVCPGHL